MQLSDTTPRARARYLERIRSTPPQQRLARAFRLSNQVRAATMADIRRRYPNATQQELATAFLRRVYGDAIADGFAARHSVE